MVNVYRLRVNVKTTKLDFCTNSRFFLIFCLFYPVLKILELGIFKFDLFKVQTRFDLLFKTIKTTLFFENQSILSKTFCVLVHKTKINTS